MFHAHVRGGSFYLAHAGSGEPGEWQITIDDFIRTYDVNTFWFGYHDGYDIEAGMNPLLPPTSGTVEDYTARRVGFTLEWARRNFPVDTSRVYVMGASMGDRRRVPRDVAPRPDRGHDGERSALRLLVHVRRESEQLLQRRRGPAGFL